MQINIEKRLFLILLGIMFLLVGGLVYAYGTSSPSSFGHSLGELGIEKSGYSIFVMPTGNSYQCHTPNCVAGEFKILLNTDTPSCYSYSNGIKLKYTWDDCPGGMLSCLEGFVKYCATRNTLYGENLGQILVAD